jgi:cell division protein FtsB
VITWLTALRANLFAMLAFCLFAVASVLAFKLHAERGELSKATGKVAVLEAQVLAQNAAVETLTAATTARLSTAKTAAKKATAVTAEASVRASRLMATEAPASCEAAVALLVRDAAGGEL